MEDAMLRMFSPAECLQFQLGADTYHSHPRLVLVKPLQADWRARLCQAPGSSP